MSVWRNKRSWPHLLTRFTNLVNYYICHRAKLKEKIHVNHHREGKYLELCPVALRVVYNSLIQEYKNTYIHICIRSTQMNPISQDSLVGNGIKPFCVFINLRSTLRAFKRLLWEIQLKMGYFQYQNKNKSCYRCMAGVIKNDCVQTLRKLAQCFDHSTMVPRVPGSSSGHDMGKVGIPVSFN